MIALHPGGARGYLFQSYLCPCICSYADFDGSSRDARRRFSVVTTCVVSLSQSCRGKPVSVVAKADIK